MPENKNGFKSLFAQSIKREIEQEKTYQQKLADMKTWLEKRLGLRKAQS